jgi:hypothetical protein
MTAPPPAHGAALPAGPLRRPAPSARPWSLPRTARGRLTAIAAAVLAVCVAAGISLAVTGRLPGLTGKQALGTAALASATCSDWNAAGPGRQAQIVGTLELAATGPDPENRGATLSKGAAFIALDRACSTAASRAVLLYGAYNRAASFQPAAVGSSFGSGGFGTASHR